MKTTTILVKRTFLALSALYMLAALASCGGRGKPKTNAGEAATSEQTALASGNHKLPFERGSYTEISNALGTEINKTIYFDKWGDWTAAETKIEMKIMGTTHLTHEIEIIKGRKHWDIDLVEKTGTTYDAGEFTTGMAAALGAAMGSQMAEGMEIEDLGTEEYLGYPCKKTRVKYAQMEMDATQLAYGNLTMKMEGSVGRINVDTKITSIDLSAPPAGIFEVPEGVEITQ